MKRLVLVLLFTLTVVGCTTTQKGSTLGALGGAALGGIIGHQSGKGLEGAAIGGAAGALGGYAVGDKMKKKFCPEGGKHYDETINFCPVHGIELKYKEK